MQRASTETKVWFALIGILIWLGIYLTGFSNVHWLLYIPAIALIFAAITGICPSQLLVSSLCSLASLYPGHSSYFCGYYWNMSEPTFSIQFLSL
jgi:uncharacterized membrane protein YcfT